MNGLSGIGAYRATAGIAGVARTSGVVDGMGTAAITGGVSDPVDRTEISATGRTLSETAAKNAGASDPFRAYRDESGNISLREIARINALPPRLRDAARLTAEAKSLTKDINAAEKAEPRDEKAIAGLRGELAGVRAELSAELEKLGLSKAMSDKGLSLDDVISGGIGEIGDLAKAAGGDDGTSGSTEAPAKAKKRSDEASLSPGSILASALDRLAELVAPNTARTDTKSAVGAASTNR